MLLVLVQAIQQLAAKLHLHSQENREQWRPTPVDFVRSVHEQERSMSRLHDVSLSSEGNFSGFGQGTSIPASTAAAAATAGASTVASAHTGAFPSRASASTTAAAQQPSMAASISGITGHRSGSQSVREVDQPGPFNTSALDASFSDHEGAATSAQRSNAFHGTAAADAPTAGGESGSGPSYTSFRGTSRPVAAATEAADAPPAVRKAVSFHGANADTSNTGPPHGSSSPPPTTTTPRSMEGDSFLFAETRVRRGEKETYGIGVAFPQDHSRVSDEQLDQSLAELRHLIRSYKAEEEGEPISVLKPIRDQHNALPPTPKKKDSSLKKRQSSNAGNRTSKRKSNRVDR